MKKFKLAFLLGIIALFCFAAAAIAAPKSLVITDMDDGTHFGAGQTFSSFGQLWANIDGKMGNPSWLPNSYTAANVPASDELLPFIPIDHTGDVSADIYYRAEFSGQTPPSGAESNVPANKYQLSGPSGAPYYPDALPLIKTVIVFGSDGKAELCDATLGDSYGSPVINFELKEAKSYPVRVYGLTFSHTPLPKHTVTATTGGHGTITPPGADVEEGASQDFKITADKGYVIDTLKVDGSEITAAAGEASFTYTLKDVTKAQSITVTFKKSETPGKDNVSEAGVSGEGVTAAEPVFIEAADEAVASHDAYADGGKELTLVKEDGSAGDTVTFKKEALVCAVKLDVTHTDPEAAMTLTLSPAEGKSFDAAKKYYAMIQNKKSAAYTLFECAPAAGGKLTVTVKPVGDYFSENTVVVYTGTAAGSATPDTPTTGGGSGGGCNAGMAVLALLSFAPLALRRRR